MPAPDYEILRARLVAAAAEIAVAVLRPEAIESIAWSGSRLHLENVALQLARMAVGEVEYLAVTVDGHAVSKGGIDFAKEDGAGTIWQLATHRELEGLGLATRLIGGLERRAARRGINHLRLAVEPDNDRALRLYEHLGYRRIGTSEASWESERSDGSRFMYSTTLVEMSKLV